jgi:uncharacterized protein
LRASRIAETNSANISMRVLIDGYNLLYQSGHLGKGRGPGFLERARSALVRAIAAALEAEQARATTIVFDAKEAPPAASPRETSGGIEILYAVGYDEADDLLEELIRQAPQPKQLLVVSSDRRVQQIAHRCRAKYCDAGDWYEQLQRARSETRPPPSAEKPDQPLSDREVDYWRSQFLPESDSPSGTDENKES